MTPEGLVLKSVMDYLQVQKIPAWRMNSGAMRGQHKGKKWFVRFGTPGMADIMAWLWSGFSGEGTILWIECKAGKGKQSEAQQEFESYVKNCGMEYIVARGIDDVDKWLKEFRK